MLDSWSRKPRSSSTAAPGWGRSLIAAYCSAAKCKSQDCFSEPRVLRGFWWPRRLGTRIAYTRENQHDLRKRHKKVKYVSMVSHIFDCCIDCSRTRLHRPCGYCGGYCQDPVRSLPGSLLGIPVTWSSTGLRTSIVASATSERCQQPRRVTLEIEPEQRYRGMIPLLNSESKPDEQWQRRLPER